MGTAKSVLLLGGADQQVLPMIKAFHELGCYVGVVCGSKLDVGYVSRFTDRAILCRYSDTDPEQMYLCVKDVISFRHYDVVIPMNDMAAAMLSKHKDELSQYSFISVNDESVFCCAIDKLKTMQICMENKIPCPKTALVMNWNDFDDREWDYPLVIKPRVGYGAKGFSVVQNHDELIAAYTSVEAKYGAVLVQEYIPQTSSQYQVEMFMDRDGICKSLLVMDKLRWYPLNGGSSTLNVTVKDVAIEESCIALLRKIGWRGYASLDIIRDPRDGIAKIMEINPRLNGTAKICFTAGINTAALFLEEASNLSITSQLEYKTGLYLRYFYKDVLWFIKSPNRFNVKPSWFSWKNTVDEIVSIEDIIPAITFFITSILKLFKSD